MITINRRNLSLAAGMAAAVALTAGALIASTAHVDSGLPVGRPAPDFTVTDSNGDPVSLSDFAGRTVVLEWMNESCPFVRKHYAQPPGNMQGLQADADADGTVWLTVISSAPGKQGYVDGPAANQWAEERGASPAHVLLDADGALGRLYQAKTTPQMFIIGPKGQVVYRGAIDSAASANVADIASATNYVREALTSLSAEEPIGVSSTKPYGCSVKY